MSDYNPNVPPKKRPFSLQLDVSKFEAATDEEKAQQEVMREKAVRTIMQGKRITILL